MNKKADIQIHVILKQPNKHIATVWVCHVPAPGDELRLGGKDKETYYKVERIVWVYDEHESPFDRVNIEVTKVD